MNKLDYNADSSPDYMMKCFQLYREYLLSIKDKLPKNAFDFAIADWHYDRSDHRCPQTAWVESLQIIEREIPVVDREVSESSEMTIDLKIRLLGAYNDGKIELNYSGVIFYDLTKAPFIFQHPTTYHGDWVIDEINLSDDDLIVHKIELAFASCWIIHCKDIEYRWLPFEKNLS